MTESFGSEPDGGPPRNPAYAVQNREIRQVVREIFSQDRETSLGKRIEALALVVVRRHGSQFAEVGCAASR